jgi:RNA polymerase sigma-70 factor, ECF subfamily
LLLLTFLYSTFFLMPDGSDDVDLLAALATGNVDALGILYDRHVGVLMPVAAHIVGDALEAEDVVHDAFLAVCDRAGDYTPTRGKVVAWLVVIVRNLAIDRLRRRQRRARIARDEVAHEPPAAKPPNPESESHHATARAVVVRVLEAMAPLQRELLLATFFEGATYEEVARREGVPLGTIKSRAARALASLRASFEAEGLSFDDLL